MSEQQEPAQSSLDEAIEAFQRMSVPDGPPSTALLERLGDELADQARPAPIPFSPKRSGLAMRLLLPSAAAAVLVLGGLGLLLLGGATSPALADVVKAATKHRLVRYQETRVTSTKEQSAAVLRSTVYVDFTAPRLYSESRVKEPNGDLVLLSVHDGKHHLTTNSRQKTARLDLAPKGYKSLLCCLEELQQKKGVAHENRDLDGRPTAWYRSVEGKQTTILWVDAKTKLPLRLEQESLDPSPGITRSTLVWTDLAWDPELPPGLKSLDELFSTRPPDGYALDDHTQSRRQ
jgi:hypothetical protein